MGQNPDLLRARNRTTLQLQLQLSLFGISEPASPPFARTAPPIASNKYSRDAVIITLRTDDIESSSTLTGAFLHLVTLRSIRPP